MPKNKVSDLITDQEIVFAHLVLSGTVTDRRAAEIAGLTPETAAYTKAKPRIRDYMLAHRAEVHERLVQQETEEVRRLNMGRERVLARLWEIADLDPESTRNSMSAQIKALSMIVAIEGLIPDRRAASAQNKPAFPLVHPQIDITALLRDQQGKTTSPDPSPDLVHDEDRSGVAADAPSDLGPAPGLALNSSETTPSAPHARVPNSAQENRVPSPVEKKPDTWRLRL
jgi:hypothetical protein